MYYSNHIYFPCYMCSLLEVCKRCACTALKDPTVIFHGNNTAKTLPFPTCIPRQTFQFSSLTPT